MSERGTWATPGEFADWFGVSTETLRRWRKEGHGPMSVKEGRTVRYAWSDIYAWANRRRKAAQ